MRKRYQKACFEYLYVHEQNVENVFRRNSNPNTSTLWHLCDRPHPSLHWNAKTIQHKCWRA